MEKRNMILAVAISVVILFGWQKYMEKYSPPLSSPEQAHVTQNKGDSVNSPLIGSVSSKVIPVDQVLSETPRVTVHSNSLNGSINLKGGYFDDLTLNAYYQAPNKKGGNIRLLSPKSSAFPYYVRFSWLGDKDIVLPDDNTVWKVDGENHELTPDTMVTLSWESPQHIIFKQIYRMDEKYMISVSQEVVNGTDKRIHIVPYGYIARIGTKKLVHYYLLHEGMIGYLDHKLRETKYDAILKSGVENYKSKGGWLGITDKYWLVGLIPDQSYVIQSSFRSGQVDGHDVYQANYEAGDLNIMPGATGVSNTRFFAGAKVTSVLAMYQKLYNIPDFKLAVDFGALYILTEPIFYIIHWLHEVLGNFGLAIIALTILIKLVLFPLSYKSYVSMSRMKLLQPQLQEIKAKYGSDRQKINTETMALYKKEKVNPVSGCLPMLIQLPIFFSLYKVLFITIEMRHAPFYGWIHDLSAPDTLGILTGFGLFHWTVPAFFAVINIGLWPIFMGASMWLQQSLSPNTMSPEQAKVMKFLPIIFPFFMAHFPSGLVIYWTCNNLLTALQQIVTTYFLERKKS